MLLTPTWSTLISLTVHCPLPPSQTCHAIGDCGVQWFYSYKFHIHYFRNVFQEKYKYSLAFIAKFVIESSDALLTLSVVSDFCGDDSFFFIQLTVVDFREQQRVTFQSSNAKKELISVYIPAIGWTDISLGEDPIKFIIMLMTTTIIGRCISHSLVFSFCNSLLLFISLIYKVNNKSIKILKSTSMSSHFCR